MTTLSASSILSVLFRWLVLFASLGAAALQAQSNYATPYFFSTHAGWPYSGTADGIGGTAQFSGLASMATDQAGNLYVADGAGRTIRKITPAGMTTTFAGSALESASVDGTGTAARFVGANGVAVDRAGNVYVADTSGHTIRKITPLGSVTTLAGAAGESGFVDGNGNTARFKNPFGVAVDGSGNVYVADTLNSAVRIVSPGGAVRTLTDSTSTTNPVDFPDEIALDGLGNIYVSDSQNSVFKITPAGISTVIYQNVTDHQAPGYGKYRYGMAPDPAGNVYMTWGTPFDALSIVRIAADGTRATLGLVSQHSTCLAVDGTGNIYVANPDSSTIQKLTSTGVTAAFAGTQGGYGSTDGAGSVARFSFPKGAACDQTGNIYVADYNNNSIRKVSPSGVVSTLAGGQIVPIPVLTDGPGSTAQFSHPEGVAVDRDGNVYVTDSGYHVIRKITPGSIVSTFAGDPNRIGTSDGPATQAQFRGPAGIAVDQAGNLYVSDEQENTIRKISPTGTVTTLAGAPGPFGSDDGTGSTARFFYPHGLAVDTAGNVYVADTNNCVIRKITPAGAVTTFAGTAGVIGSADGVGPAAQFNAPYGITIDAQNNLYVTDSWNHSIRMITPTGVVTTLAGLPGFPNNPHFSIDGVGRDVRFTSYPTGIALDSAGNLFVVDTGNDIIRKGRPAGPPNISLQPQSQAAANGSSVQFSVTASATPAPTYQWYFNGTPFSGATSNTLSFTNARSADAGDYTVVVTNSLGSVTSSKATLTVNPTTVTPPTSPPTGGGGGSIEAWFVLALLVLGMKRARKNS